MSERLKGVNAASVVEIAERQANRWRDNPYYDDAEEKMDRQWNELVWPFISGSKFNYTLELACGHGRNSEYLLRLSDRLILVDVNIENIDYCKKRFSGRDKDISYIVNSGADLSQVPDSTVDFLYCFDSMVHFHSDVVRSYLSEIHRCLRKDGRAFLHHSNSTANPGGLDISKHIRGRNYMSRSLFEHYAVLVGLSVIKSNIVDWAGVKDLDCITLLQKP